MDLADGDGDTRGARGTGEAHKRPEYVIEVHRRVLLEQDTEHEDLAKHLQTMTGQIREKEKPANSTGPTEDIGGKRRNAGKTLEETGVALADLMERLKNKRRCTKRRTNSWHM